MEIVFACVNSALRSIAAVIALQVLARVNGAKQISQLPFYDYITGITIGSMAAVMAIDDRVPVYIPLLSMIIFVAASYLEGKWTINSIKARKYIDGMPMLLMSEGNILQANMRKAHLTVNDLLSEARVAGYFDLSQVAYAIMENSGKISFLAHSQHQPATCKDMHIPTTKVELFVNVIIDGEVLEHELAMIHKNLTWLDDQLHKQGLSSVNDVLLAIANMQGELHCYRKDETSSHDHSFL